MAILILLYSVPLILANIVHHWLVIPRKIFSPLAYAVDGGTTFRGRRILGPHKTMRGFVVVPFLTALGTLIIANLFGVSTDTPPFLLGLLIGLAYMAGELPNSFLKRQCVIREGTRGPGTLGAIFMAIDQIDSIAAAGIMIYLLEKPPFTTIISLTMIGVAAHLALDTLLHRSGYKSSDEGRDRPSD
jgi:hypothetical protein